MNKKINKKTIPDEKLGAIAEKGLRGVHLNKKKWHFLRSSGLEDVYSLWNMRKSPVPQLEKAEVDGLMDRFFPNNATLEKEAPSIILRLRDAIVELTQTSLGWNSGSPVFAYRAGESKNVILHREIGKVTVHLEVVLRAPRLVDLRVSVTDESKRDKVSFEAELLQKNSCVEAVNGLVNETVTFRRIETGDYVLRISDAKGEITSLKIGMLE